MGQVEDEYASLFVQWKRLDRAANAYDRLHDETLTFVEGGGATPDFFDRLNTATGGLFAETIEDLQTLKGLPAEGGEGGQGILMGLTVLAKRQRDAADALLEPLFFASEIDSSGRFARDFGEGRAELLGRTVPGVGGTGGTDKPFTWQVLPGGMVIRHNKATGQSEIILEGSVAGPADTIMQRDNGDLVAISASGAARVLVAGFGFAQIDPERAFALEAQKTDVAFRSLELQSRSQEIQALGQDMANGILLGRLEVDVATFGLIRMNSALDVRREERNVALKFAVTSTSIRTLPDGTRVLRSPLAEATARTLGLPEGALDLPVGTVNPEASAQALLDATQLDSPIPDLEAQAAATAAATAALITAPLQGAPSV